MTKRVKGWCLRKTPAWMLRFKATHPRIFWTVLVALVIIPFGITAAIGLQVLFNGLSWAASYRLW